MGPYLIAHVPHAGMLVPPEMYEHLTEAEIEASLVEAAVVCDWHTEVMLSPNAVDETIEFPYARTFCDVERYVFDPLDKVGQGLFYTKTVDGRFLRGPSAGASCCAVRIYEDYHAQMSRGIAKTLGLMPVVMIDMHSYSDFQADQTGRSERPDICVGGDTEQTPQWMVDRTRAVFERHGYTTTQNRPYEGSMIPRGFLGNPDFSTIMFEVHKRLYLGPDNQPIPRQFEKLRIALEEGAALLRGEP
ncbi:MAG: hypothetical protein EOO77_31190 [Oxalobacteraceae bacterium]|nr:MAG: hypothetical protein EOO77_31190 [Oxalobacteraceae bacterium]